MFPRLQDIQMQQPRTPYQVLNVAPDAEPEVIEAAYKALMKKYHPDKIAGGPPLSESKAAEINDAFRTLRDPARRARHDSEEKARRPVIAGADWSFDPARGGAPFAPKAEPRPAPSQANRPPPPPRPYYPMVVVAPRRATGREIIGWAGVLSALLLIGLALALSQGSGGIGASPFGATSTTAAGGDGGMLAGKTPVSQQRIGEALVEFERVRALYGPVGVAAYSDSCFGAQSRSRELSDFDFCVAFDHAASALDPAPSESFRAPPVVRLTEGQLDSRHVAAARLEPTDYQGLDQRLTDIKMMTYAVIAQSDVAGANGEAAQGPAPTASASGQPPRAVRRAPPQRYARSSGARQPARRSQGAARDAEFLEREGGIY